MTLFDTLSYSQANAFLKSLRLFDHLIDTKKSAAMHGLTMRSLSSS